MELKHLWPHYCWSLYANSRAQKVSRRSFVISFCFFSPSSSFYASENLFQVAVCSHVWILSLPEVRELSTDPPSSTGEDQQMATTGRVAEQMYGAHELQPCEVLPLVRAPSLPQEKSKLGRSFQRHLAGSVLQKKKKEKKSAPPLIARHP